MRTKTPDTRVIGVGSPIMGDDGFGLRVMDRLGERWELPEEVALVDGGTWGMQLLPEIEASDCVIFIDAINTGSAPGTIAVVERAELPRYFERKLSPHQVDLREVLAICELRGTLPRVTVAFGAQPETIEMSTSLSPALAARVDEVADLVAGRLASLGHDVRRRQPAAA
ncbi:MAG: rane protein [Gemmatimonadetes bacterium]|nr:rane protein [Gemmatimonadota bacterium]